MHCLLILTLLLIFSIPKSGFCQEGTELIPVVGGMTIYFIQNGEESAHARSQNTLKLNIGASMDSRLVDIVYFASRDIQLIIRHNQAYALSNNVVSQGQELGSRYFLWNKIFVEAGFFHALRREKAYLYFPRNPGTGLYTVQYWTERYENYGNYAGLGTEAQFRHFSIGLMALHYQSWRTWKKNGASVSDLPEAQHAQLTDLNQECRDAYQGKWETSILMGISF